MSTEGAELRALVRALKGAVQWHLECGHETMPVPMGFTQPTFETPRSETEALKGTTVQGTANTGRSSARPPRLDDVSVQSTRHTADRRRSPQENTRPVWQVIPIDTNVEGTEMGQRAASLQALKDQLNVGNLCAPECQHTELVFGHGHPGAKVLFVGESPGEREDAVGLPFVDDAGVLLGKMIRAMGLKRNDVYLTYLVKCYCPSVSLEEQLDPWSSALATEIHIVQPEVIIALGEVAARRLTGHDAAFPHLRGKWFDYQGIAVMPTFHPQALLQHPQSKGMVWSDLKAVMRHLGLSGASR